MDPITMQLVADKYICLALEEDISSEGVSINPVMPEYKKDEVQLICRKGGIIARLRIFERVFTPLDPETRVVFDIRGGGKTRKGQRPAIIAGGMRILLSDGRTALNYLQRLSGIATYTHTVAGILEGTGTRLLDTRKATLCMHIFERYVVRIGGGQNHRCNLPDGALLKDNHIDAAEGVGEAVTTAKACAPFVRRIEVETESLDTMREAADVGAGIIVLDNMTPEQMAEATCYIDGRAETEYSGNITKGNIRAVTELGVDHVSSGALAHSSPILDTSLEHLKMLTD